MNVSVDLCPHCGGSVQQFGDIGRLVYSCDDCSRWGPWEERFTPTPVGAPDGTREGGPR